MPINLQPRDIRILLAVVTYGCLTRRQLQRLVPMPDRIMRRRARLLARDGYVNRYTPAVADDPAGPPTPVYYPAKRGCEILSQELRDDRFLLTRTSLPQASHVAHAVAVAQTHILLTEAIARQSQVQLVEWFNENEIVNKDERDPSRHHTTCIHFGDLGKGKILCKPDSVFGLRSGEATCIYFLEEDRNTTTSADKLLRRKLSGYEKTFATGKHLAHFGKPFPGALPIFRVLFVTTTPARRDALRRAMHQRMRDKPRQFADVWRFVEKRSDLTVERFLHGSIFYPCDPRGEACALVKPDSVNVESAPVATSAAAEPVLA